MCIRLCRPSWELKRSTSRRSCSALSGSRSLNWRIVLMRNGSRLGARMENALKRWLNSGPAGFQWILASEKSMSTLRSCRSMSDIGVAPAVRLDGVAQVAGEDVVVVELAGLPAEGDPPFVEHVDVVGHR